MPSRCCLLTFEMRGIKSGPSRLIWPCFENQLDKKPNSAAVTERPSPWRHSLNRRGTVFNRLKKSNKTSHLTDKSIKYVISVRAEESDARRCCSICGVLCDGLFPQSESAPLAVFGHTLHSSAAQHNHTPLPWQQTNKKKNQINVCKTNKKKNESACRHDTSEGRESRKASAQTEVKVEG